MRDRPSFTAAWVAAARSFGVHLPEEARLADDPYGARFARTTALVGRPFASKLFPRRFVLYMQVRTRVLDDALHAFVKDGGTQIVLLGAGFDCRALRFAHELSRANATVFEVDHPATQAKKRDVLRGDVGAHTEYVAWDFEKNPMRDLPAELARHGHDAKKRTLTIWEGVTMYLSDDAIHASVTAMRDYSAPGSRLAMTYVDRALFEHPTLRARASHAFVSRIGEPLRFGWHPSELPAWMRTHGFEVERDASAREWGRELLPPKFALKMDENRRFAICMKAALT